LLETLGLTVGRGRTPVGSLEDAALGAGDAALILGPSGSGKTTALFTLAGLLPPIDGMVRLDGEAFSGLPAHRRATVRGRRMGVVFQDMHLLSGLSVLDNLLLAPFAAGLPQDRAAAFERLRAVGLEHLADRQAERLSRGEAQRVAVARAMLMTPRLLLADEPTASLDDANAHQVVDLLLEASRSTGATLVIATHDQRLTCRIPGRLALHPCRIEAAA